MSVEVSVYTREPAMTGVRLRALAEPHGLELRMLDLTGRPLASTAPLKKALTGQAYVLIGWPSEQAETTAAVDQAIQRRDKPALDRLGKNGQLGWCEFGCRAFDFPAFEAGLKADMEENDEDEALIAPEQLDRLREAKTRYVFRSATRPKQCSALLERVAGLIRQATDGFGDE